MLVFIPVTGAGDNNRHLIGAAVSGAARQPDSISINSSTVNFMVRWLNLLITQNLYVPPYVDRLLFAAATHRHTAPPLYLSL